MKDGYLRIEDKNVSLNLVCKRVTVIAILAVKFHILPIVLFS